MLTVTKEKESAEDCQCTAHEAGQKIRAMVDNATYKARDTLATTEEQIRRNPLAAGVIATGIGFLLGTLFRRR